MAEPHPVLAGFREDLFEVTLEIPGILTVTVDKMSGGGVKSKDAKHRPANGLENILSLGGAREVENITMSRLNDETVQEKTTELLEQAGRAKVKVHKQPLDENGHPYGSALTYAGRLLDVTPPDTDSEGDKAAMISFVVSLETDIF